MVVVYSFTVHEAVLKKSEVQGRCRVHVGSMCVRYDDDVFVDGTIYRINEEVEEEEGIQE